MKSVTRKIWINPDYEMYQMLVCGGTWDGFRHNIVKNTRDKIDYTETIYTNATEELAEDQGVNLNWGKFCYSNNKEYSGLVEW